MLAVLAPVRKFYALPRLSWQRIVRQIVLELLNKSIEVRYIHRIGLIQSGCSLDDELLWTERHQHNFWAHVPYWVYSPATTFSNPG